MGPYPVFTAQEDGPSVEIVLLRPQTIQSATASALDKPNEFYV